VAGNLTKPDMRANVMAKKKPESTPPEKRADMTVVQQESKSRGAHLSDLAVSPTFRAAITERQIIGTTMS
jgi:hypothetical protein